MIKIFFALIATALIVGCGSANQSNISTAETEDELANSVITFESLNLSLQSIREQDFVYLVEDVSISLSIDLTKNSYSGKSGCNSYFGETEKIGEDVIHFKLAGTTEMMCTEDIMKWEARFLNALVDGEFRVTEMSQYVTFIDASENIKLTFKKAE